MNENIRIKQLSPAGLRDGLPLVWEVFLEFEAPDYTQEGVMSFKKSIYDIEFLSALTAYGAFDGDRLAGLIATRREGSHIALFFVDREHQGKGIGRMLFAEALGRCRAKSMTVNSSPYAVPIYKHLGFSETDSEQVMDGIRFIPMKRNVTRIIRGKSI